MRKYYQDSLRLMKLLIKSKWAGMAEGGWWRREEREEGRSVNHIKFPCYIRHLYGESIDIHVLDFKWMCVNFDNLFRNKIFGLQLFVSIESFPIHISGIRHW